MLVTYLEADGSGQVLSQGVPPQVSLLQELSKEHVKSSYMNCIPAFTCITFIIQILLFSFFFFKFPTQIFASKDRL